MIFYPIVIVFFVKRFEIKPPGEIQEVNRIQDKICLIKLKDYLNDEREKD